MGRCKCNYGALLSAAERLGIARETFEGLYDWRRSSYGRMLFEVWEKSGPVEALAGTALALLRHVDHLEDQLSRRPPEEVEVMISGPVDGNDRKEP